MANEKYTFWQLLSKKKVVIPIIQRDYAQGRKNKEYVRKNFLEQLGRALFENESTELDFVYGTEYSSPKDGIINMYPLDGQQRLTTLWLLHWYVSYNAMRLPEAKDILKRFSYETRATSREFCKRLCDLPFADTEKIVECIKQQTWFFSAWEQDPTIKAMLTMLSGTNNAAAKDDDIESNDTEKEDFIDGIEELFKQKQKDDFCAYWELLTGNGCTIRFNFLPLNSADLPLSDDLYIKMNARGKALTSFENFKADLIQWISKDENRKHWGENDNQINEALAQYASFIDNQWTDVFWQNNKDGKIDDIYFAFINRYLLNIAIVNEDIIIRDNKPTKGETIWKLYGKESIDSEFCYLDFAPYRAFNYPHIFKKLQILFENIAGFDVNPYLPDWAQKEYSTLSFIPKYNGKSIPTLTQPQRVIFYGICKYFEANEFKEIAFKRWVRVLCNLVQNPTISNVDSMVGRLKLINEISSGCADILTYLADENNSVKSQDQLIEERAKARQIILKIDVPTAAGPNEAEIIRAENYAFFNGTISFLFTNEEGKLNWEDFDVKWSNITKLIPANLKERDTIANLIEYLSDEQLKNIFQNFKLNNTDFNLRQILLKHTNEVHKWLIHQEPESSKTLLQKQLLAIADMAIVENFLQEYRLHPAWVGNLDVMSNYSYRSGDYKKHSLIVGSNILLDAFRMLKEEESFSIDSKPISNAQDAPIKGLYVKFSYQNQTFIWQRTNWVDMYDKNEEKLFDRGGEYENLHAQYVPQCDNEYQFNDVGGLKKQLDRCIKKYIELKKIEGTGTPADY